LSNSLKNSENTLEKSAKTLFTKRLMTWNSQFNRRKMPWKGEKDPYKIWLSEIILQQTRVEQGLAYYNRFIEKYPNILALANAKDEHVFKLWEGLGYYSRCKNILITARYIAFELGGIFPIHYEEILQLKGVGPYTAAAIASFAYNQPYAVVDGNVFRVIARYFGIDEPTDSTAGKFLFTKWANELLLTKEPGLYNQAIMDFGATVCKPALPLCATCILSENCTALAFGKVNVLPVKTKSIQKKQRWFYYFIFHVEGKLAIIKRSNKDIWQGLYEFYLFESSKEIKWKEKEIHHFLQDQLGVKEFTILKITNPQKQQLTHQQINGQFIEIKLPSIPTSLMGLEWVKQSALKQLAFPRFITTYFENPV
jgi:A/G-specific adenine glycosylase